MPPKPGGSRTKTALIAVAIVVAGIVGLGIIGALAGDPDEGGGDASGPGLPDIPDILDLPDRGVQDFELGDCFDDNSDAPVASTDTSFVDAQVELVPCSGLHDAEVYHVFDFSAPADTPYPGDGPLFDAAVDACLAQFEPFVGAPYETSSLDMYFLVPSPDGFSRFDDREIVCAAINLDGSPLGGGTVRGSRR
jgi:hypothetical protein